MSPKSLAKSPFDTRQTLDDEDGPPSSHLRCAAGSQRAGAFDAAALAIAMDAGAFDAVRVALAGASGVGALLLRFGAEVRLGRFADAERTLAPIVHVHPAIGLLQDAAHAEAIAVGRRKALLAYDELVVTRRADRLPGTLHLRGGRVIPFDHLVDSDGLVGARLTAYADGRVEELPFSRLREVRFGRTVDLDAFPPATIFDALWIPADITFVDGSRRDVFVPARLPNCGGYDDAHVQRRLHQAALPFGPRTFRARKPTRAPVEVGPPSLATPLPANSLAVANGRAPSTGGAICIAIRDITSITFAPRLPADPSLSSWDPWLMRAALAGLLAATAAACLYAGTVATSLFVGLAVTAFALADCRRRFRRRTLEVQAAKEPDDDRRHGV